MANLHIKINISFSVAYLHFKINVSTSLGVSFYIEKWMLAMLEFSSGGGGGGD